MEGLAQREIGSENIGYLLINRIAEPPTVSRREVCYFLVALHSGTEEYAPLRSILSDSNYRQGNAQDNTQDNVFGSAKKVEVPAKQE
jgi:hypothetical protein